MTRPTAQTQKTTISLITIPVDWNGIRENIILATENDTLNATAMLLGHMVTNGAAVFADVRTYWSPDAVKRVTGWTPEGLAKNGFIHLINSGAAALDGCGQQRDENDQNVMKPWYDVTADDAKNCLEATQWCPASATYFRGGGFSSHFKTDAVMPVTLIRVNWIDGFGPNIQLAEGFTTVLPEEVHRIIDQRTDPTWPTTWFVPNLTGQGVFTDVYSVIHNWTAIIRKYLDVSELDRTIIDELIDHIEIGERMIVDGQRRQEIKVFYRFVGLVE